MTKASQNKDAAWSFMEFALGPEGAPDRRRSGRTVPSLKSVAESDAFLDPSVKPANSQVFLDTIPVIQQVPSDLDLARDRGRGGGDPRERRCTRACRPRRSAAQLREGDDADLRARRGLSVWPT